MTRKYLHFLTKLSFKGEAANEIAGGVYILREKAKRVYIDNTIDTCGTGGDGLNSLNISTAAAIYLQVWGLKLQNMEIKLYPQIVALQMMFWRLLK